MEYLPIALSVVALLVALVALSKAGAPAKRIDELESELKRRDETRAEATRDELEKQRRMMSEIVRGTKLTPDMVMENRLWVDVPAARAVEMLAAGGMHVIDVRTPAETALGIVAGAKLIPVDQLEQRMREIPKDGKPKLLYCMGGGRSAAACELLSEKGYVELYNLEGGFQSWSGPREKPK